jgi:hypothetical protein
MCEDNSEGLSLRNGMFLVGQKTLVACARGVQNVTKADW